MLRRLDKWTRRENEDVTFTEVQTSAGEEEETLNSVLMDSISPDPEFYQKHATAANNNHLSNRLIDYSD